MGGFYKDLYTKTTQKCESHLPQIQIQDKLTMLATFQGKLRYYKKAKEHNI